MVILELESIDSTNEEAKRIIKKGLFEDTAILAHIQSSGRGRYGREWQSPEGNLYFSVALKNKYPLQQAAQISFIAAIAAKDFIQSLAPKTAIELKWPNDVLIGDKKIAGILLESYNDHVIVGVGINIASRPEGLDRPVTCLANYGKTPAISSRLLEEWLFFFDKYLNLWHKSSFAVIRDCWIKNAWKLGKQINIKIGNEKITGIFKDINDKGELVLESNGK